MRLKDLIQRTRNNLIELLWRQWTQLGVAGTAEHYDHLIIDPEALLLFTMEFGRYDPRLFDEVVDWCMQNERWLSLQRLKNLAENWERDISTRSLRALANTMKSSAKKHRWQTLAQIEIRKPAKPIAFFIDIDGTPIPMMEQRDIFFAETGLLRHPIAIRGLSASIPMDAKPLLILKLRSLFGLGPRAEIITYLLTHPNANVSEIAHATGYTRPPVQETMNALAEGHYVTINQTRSRKLYSVDAERWKCLIGIDEPFPRWIDWPYAFSALNQLQDFFIEMEGNPPSDYILKSRLITLNDRMRDELSETSLHRIFVESVDLTTVPEEFERRIDILLANLVNQD